MRKFWFAKKFTNRPRWIDSIRLKSRAGFPYLNTIAPIHFIFNKVG
jgi:hypothetical protein